MNTYRIAIAGTKTISVIAPNEAIARKRANALVDSGQWENPQRWAQNEDEAEAVHQ